MTKHSATATAHANIALAKYWGKSNVKQNIPAVPSLSMTLNCLSTTTRVTFNSKQKKDLFFLDGKKINGRSLDRVTGLLDLLREKSRSNLHAKVESENNFPTAAGLASSASGFCALAAAASKALELQLSLKELSHIARLSSASAARSVFGGFVELKETKVAKTSHHFAKQIADENYWDLCLVIAIIEKGQKALGSTEAMERAKKTSLLYSAWVEQAPLLFHQCKKALKQKKLDALGDAMEKSTFAFHATTWTSSPSFSYWQPGTVEALSTIRALREQKGISAWATMDAGPNVKVLCHTKDAARVKKALQKNPSIKQILIAKPGSGIRAWKT